MKTFKKYFKITALPEHVYNALTKEDIIEIWTGESAVMKEEAGTEFSLWDGSISGMNLEFVKNEKIVQEWFFGDQDNPSVVTIKLHPDQVGTVMEVIHTNIPEEAFENISSGWKEDYFAALNELFEE